MRVAVKSACVGTLIGLALLLAGCADHTARDRLRWESIFDGRTLNGWTPKIVGEPMGSDGRQTFVVRNGAIAVNYAHYDRFAGRFGHLFYKERLRYFRLRLRYRFLDPGLADAPVWARSNSGVMLLAQDPHDMARDQSFPISIEAQLLGKDGDGPRPTGAVCTPGTDIVIVGIKAPAHCTASTGPTIANGEWVSVELDVLPSGEIIHRINGAVVMRYSQPALDPSDPRATDAVAQAAGRLAIKNGYLALQSEGHPIEFMNIELQRLSADVSGSSR